MGVSAGAITLIFLFLKSHTPQNSLKIIDAFLQIADCCLVPQVFNARRFHVDLRPYPIILRIDRELEVHPAFRAAHPSNQPDCPPEAAK